MKHFSVISKFFQQNDCTVEGIPYESLTDLIYSDSNQKILIYDDVIYSRLVDSLDLNWEENAVVLLGPKDNYQNLAPPGFNQANIHSIEYFTKIYSAFKKDISAIFCAKSQKNIVVNKNYYDIFEINEGTEYEDVLNFCKNRYDNVDIVDGVGQYAKRGGIIDVFPDQHSSPKRLIFLNEKTEIKIFDLDSQRAIRKIKNFKIATLQKNKTFQEVLYDECAHWKSYEITQEGLLINNNTNTNRAFFPFKKINYSDFKKTHVNYKVTYESVNRFYGFINQETIVAPSWFKKPSANLAKSKIIDVAAINIGDYVVHRDHGVGKFAGFRASSDNSQELMIIRYLDNGQVVVDISHLEKITFYASKNEPVELDSLNNAGRWNRKKNSAKKNVQNIVNKLVNAYVNRENSSRSPIFPVEGENKFIEEFQYSETPDQSRCWKDINSDLIGTIPMDRLICGDVGFGKTELAIRAAYRYVSNSKKVIVLAPTTILCEQLFHAFHNRLNNYGIILNRVSRLRSQKEITLIKDAWVNNKLDIILGTHAILYNEIYLSACDLLIIDEEHRFGVRQKEKIKELNPSIDILTMSATPIPRTLNMALSGMKQISTLASPPRHRKPIITNINYFNSHLIINTINNEIMREGQIYFVHNNVKTIPVIIALIEKKMPHVRVNYINGQMDSKIIEKRMNEFTNKSIDLLVCTSIIENGIDIPNVNTIIINNAQDFGLSQLYQIRGRVGRSNRQAYALLMIPEKMKLNQASRLRLKAIEQYTSLGSGYKISNMDLTIRGGGSMFGYDQSGNIENVGYELVSKFINEYINHNDLDVLNEPKINFLNKGIIPEEYIVSANIRLLFYRKIKSAFTIEQITGLIEEFTDRFGHIPRELSRIIEIQKIYIICKNIHISLIEEKKDYIIIHLNQKYWEQRINSLLNKINEFVHEQAINYEIKELRETLLLHLTKKDQMGSLGLIDSLIKKIIVI